MWLARTPPKSAFSERCWKCKVLDSIAPDSIKTLQEFGPLLVLEIWAIAPLYCQCAMAVKAFLIEVLQERPFLSCDAENQSDRGGSCSPLQVRLLHLTVAVTGRIRERAFARFCWAAGQDGFLNICARVKYPEPGELCSYR